MASPRAEDELAYMRAGVGSDLDAMVVFNLLRTQSYLGPFIDATLRAQNLTAAQFNTLLVLRAAGAEGLMMSEIGQKLVVTRSNVTGLVDRLERDGLAGRFDHQDRRATVVRITPAGRELLDRAGPQLAQLASDLTGCLDEAEKQTLIALLWKLRRELRRRTKEET